MTTQHLFVTLVALLVAAAPPDWSRFRGPNGTGVAETTNLPTDGRAQRPTSCGRRRCRRGIPRRCSPSRASFSRRTPRTRPTTSCWSSRSTARRARNCGGARCRAARRGASRTSTGRPRPARSPTASRCMRSSRSSASSASRADGKERWRLPLGPFNIYYGFGASPMLVDDVLILPVDQDLGAYLLAIDRRTGKAALEGGAPARHLRLLDADGLSPGRRSGAGRDPRVVPADVVRGRRREEAVVGARAGVRDEVGGEPRRPDAVRERLGLSAEPAGPAGADGAV